MRQEIDKIEIQEPPIEKLAKKRSCFRRTCTVGCGFIVLIFALSLIFLKFTLGPKSKQLRDLPEEFTQEIPIYDTENIETITFTAGKERGKNAEIIAYIPKIIISPIALWMDKNETAKNDQNTLGKLREFIEKPITDKRDIIKIEWSLLPADRKFLIEHYRNELEKKSFNITLESKNQETEQFTFQKDEIDGVVFIHDDPKTTETDFMSLTVNMIIDDSTNN